MTAYAYPNPALPSPSHPMAKTGYGKRSTGDEDPHADPVFAHLSLRAREVAVFIDHLDDGHSMAHKVLADEHPRYGRQAVRTALNQLIDAGHLRWIKEHITLDDNTMRWVTRTYWSRTPRSAEWWAEFTRERHGKDVTRDHAPGLARAEEPQPQPEPEPERPAEQPAPDEPGVAHLTLVELRAADRRMALSESDCRSLEPLVTEWLDRGATPNGVIRALTEGLPVTVTNPGGLARNRLETKMPPKRTDRTTASRPKGGRVTRALMACGFCQQDERTVWLVNGICVECRKELEEEEKAAIPATFRP